MDGKTVSALTAANVPSSTGSSSSVGSVLVALLRGDLLFGDLLGDFLLFVGDGATSRVVLGFLGPERRRLP